MSSLIITGDASHQDLVAGARRRGFRFSPRRDQPSLEVDEFSSGNVGIAPQPLCEALLDAGRSTPVVFASSTQAGSDNPYGQSKRAAEEAARGVRRKAAGVRVHDLAPATMCSANGARPNYNSVGLDLLPQYRPRLADPNQTMPTAPLSLIYIDDVVNAMAAFSNPRPRAMPPWARCRCYETTVGDIAAEIRSVQGQPRDADHRARRHWLGACALRNLRQLSADGEVSLSRRRNIPIRAAPSSKFSRPADCGQFSYFTAHPGVTRGGHYHHSKTEKFLVIRGDALVSLSAYCDRTSGSICGPAARRRRSSRPCRAGRTTSPMSVTTR